MGEARDGEEALRAIAGNPHLAMVVCDVTMPFKTGMEVLDSLRADGRLATLPVVMLTTEGQLSVIARARQAGATGWIVEPLVAAHLVAVARAPESDRPSSRDEGLGCPRSPSASTRSGGI